MPPILTSIPYLAFLVPVFMAWGQIKGFLISVFRLVIVETHVQGPAAQPIMLYLNQHAKKAPTNVTKYSSIWSHIRRFKKEAIVLFEGVRDLPVQWYWYKRTIVTLHDKRGTDKETGVTRDALVHLRYLRGTLDTEKLLSDAVEWFRTRNDNANALDAYKSSRFYVRRYVGTNTANDIPSNSYANRTAENEVKARASISSGDEDYRLSRFINYETADVGYSGRLFFHVFNSNAKRILADVTRWFKSREWYQDKGLLWRRGSLLFGPPGSGKSSLIRKVGQALDLPVLSFELSTMTDPKFISLWDEARRESPCIIVMEDIDTVFHKREPANVNIKLSFECLLNCISGVEPAEGVYLFITTNKLEQLDEALGVPNGKGVSTRPGRLDTCFHMGDITLEEKLQIASHFLGTSDEGARLITESNGCTAAQFSDMCSQRALDLHWNSNSINSS